jgi:D-arabinose 1-dehydrogenase-like Zn-dependent alcohol dehydrogenase
VIRSGSFPSNHPFARALHLPHILGGEHAGVVDAIGIGVPETLIGRRVAVSVHMPCGACSECLSGHDQACDNGQLLGIHRQGAYAEYVVVPAANIHELPADLTFVEAAALGAANGAVAYAQLEVGGVGRGTWVLVPGANGALGFMLVYLAAKCGAHVIALVRNHAAATILEQAGAQAVLSAERADLDEALLEITGGRGVDVVIDNLSLPELSKKYMPGLAPLGRVIISGAMGEAPIPLLARPFYLKSQSILGVRSANRAQIAAFWKDVREGGVRLPPELVQIFPLAEAPAAHAALQRRSGVGVLRTQHWPRLSDWALIVSQSGRTSEPASCRNL